MTASLVVEIRYWPDPKTGKRFAQYRVRGSTSLVWIPIGIFAAEKALQSGAMFGLPVERAADAPMVRA